MVAYETNGRLRNGHIRERGVQFLERRGQMGYADPLAELVGRQFVVHVRALQARDYLGRSASVTFVRSWRASGIPYVKER